MAGRLRNRLRRCVLLSLCWFWSLYPTYLPMMSIIEVDPDQAGGQRYTAGGLKP